MSPVTGRDGPALWQLARAPYPNVARPNSSLKMQRENKTPNVKIQDVKVKFEKDRKNV